MHRPPANISYWNYWFHFWRFQADLVFFILYNTFIHGVHAESMTESVLCFILCKFRLTFVLQIIAIILIDFDCCHESPISAKILKNNTKHSPNNQPPIRGRFKTMVFVKGEWHHIALIRTIAEHSSNKEWLIRVCCKRLLYVKG